MTSQVFSCSLKITCQPETMFTTKGGVLIAKSIAALEWVDSENKFHRIMTTSGRDLEYEALPQLVKAFRQSIKPMFSNVLFADEQQDLFPEPNALEERANRQNELDNGFETYKRPERDDQ